MTIKTKTKRVPKVKIVENYIASIKVMKQVVNATGSTIREAIENLQVKNGKGMGVLTISKGGNSQSKILPPAQVQSLFSASPLRREVALKNVTMRFSL